MHVTMETLAPSLTPSLQPTGSNIHIHSSDTWKDTG